MSMSIGNNAQRPLTNFVPQQTRNTNTVTLPVEARTEAVKLPSSFDDKSQRSDYVRTKLTEFVDQQKNDASLLPLTKKSSQDAWGNHIPSKSRNFTPDFIDLSVVDNRKKQVSFPMVAANPLTTTEDGNVNPERFKTIIAPIPRRDKKDQSVAPQGLLVELSKLNNSYEQALQTKREELTEKNAELRKMQDDFTKSVTTFQNSQTNHLPGTAKHIELQTNIELAREGIQNCQQMISRNNSELNGSLKSRDNPTINIIAWDLNSKNSSAANMLKAPQYFNKLEQEFDQKDLKSHGDLSSVGFLMKAIEKNKPNESNPELLSLDITTTNNVGKSQTTGCMVHCLNNKHQEELHALKSKVSTRDPIVVVASTPVRAAVVAAAIQSTDRANISEVKHAVRSDSSNHSENNPVNTAYRIVMEEVTKNLSQLGVKDISEEEMQEAVTIIVDQAEKLYETGLAKAASQPSRIVANPVNNRQAHIDLNTLQEEEEIEEDEDDQIINRSSAGENEEQNIEVNANRTSVHENQNEILLRQNDEVNADIEVHQNVHQDLATDTNEPAIAKKKSPFRFIADPGKIIRSIQKKFDKSPHTEGNTQNQAQTNNRNQSVSGLNDRNNRVSSQYNPANRFINPILVEESSDEFNNRIAAQTANDNEVQINTPQDQNIPEPQTNQTTVELEVHTTSNDLDSLSEDAQNAQASQQASTSRLSETNSNRVSTGTIRLGEDIGQTEVDISPASLSQQRASTSRSNEVNEVELNQAEFNVAIEKIRNGLQDLRKDDEMLKEIELRVLGNSARESVVNNVPSSIAENADQQGLPPASLSRQQSINTPELNIDNNSNRVSVGSIRLGGDIGQTDVDSTDIEASVAQRTVTPEQQASTSSAQRSSTASLNGIDSSTAAGVENIQIQQTQPEITTGATHNNQISNSAQGAVAAPQSEVAKNQQALSKMLEKYDVSESELADYTSAQLEDTIEHIDQKTKWLNLHLKPSDDLAVQAFKVLNKLQSILFTKNEEPLANRLVAEAHQAPEVNDVAAPLAQQQTQPKTITGIDRLSITPELDIGESVAAAKPPATPSLNRVDDTAQVAEVQDLAVPVEEVENVAAAPLEQRPVVESLQTKVESLGNQIEATLARAKNLASGNFTMRAAPPQAATSADADEVQSSQTGERFTKPINTTSASRRTSANATRTNNNLSVAFQGANPPNGRVWRTNTYVPPRTDASNNNNSSASGTSRQNQNPRPNVAPKPNSSQQIVQASNARAQINVVPKMQNSIGNQNNSPVVPSNPNPLQPRVQASDPMGAGRANTANNVGRGTVVHVPPPPNNSPYKVRSSVVIQIDGTNEQITTKKINVNPKVATGRGTVVNVGPGRGTVVDVLPVSNNTWKENQTNQKVGPNVPQKPNRPNVAQKPVITQKTVEIPLRNQSQPARKKLDPNRLAMFEEAPAVKIGRS